MWGAQDTMLTTCRHSQRANMRTLLTPLWRPTTPLPPSCTLCHPTFFLQRKGSAQQQPQPPPPSPVSPYSDRRLNICIVPPTALCLPTSVLPSTLRAQSTPRQLCATRCYCTPPLHGPRPAHSQVFHPQRKAAGSTVKCNRRGLTTADTMTRQPEAPRSPPSPLQVSPCRPWSLLASTR